MGLHVLHNVVFAKLLQDHVKVLEVTLTTPQVALFKPFQNVKSVAVKDCQMYSYYGEDWIHVDYLTINNTVLLNMVLSQPMPQLTGSSQQLGMLCGG